MNLFNTYEKDKIIKKLVLEIPCWLHSVRCIISAAFAKVFAGVCVCMV